MNSSLKPKYAIYLIPHSEQIETNMLGYHNISSSGHHMIEISDLGDPRMNHISTIMCLINYETCFRDVNPKLVTMIQKELCKASGIDHGKFKEKVAEVRST